MPLIVLALLAYLGGLLAGFSGSIAISFAATISAAAFGATKSRAISVALAALVAGGIVASRASARDTERCVDAALRSGRANVILEDTAFAGAFSRGRVAECDAFISFSIQSGDAPPGAEVIARGAWTRSERGLSAKDVSIAGLRSPSLLKRLRTRAGAAIERTFQGDAPLVKALLIADWSELSPELRDRWAAAGISHMLSIGGFHIAIIAMAIELTLELFGVTRRRASVATILVSTLYVALIGAPVPAVRSLLMAAVVILARLLQRPVARWAVVGVGAMQPIVEPRVAVDIGYQLSVIGVAALIAAGLLAKRTGMNRLAPPVRIVALGLLGTTVATIASAPIVAWVFGRVSLVAPLTNLVAAPLITLAQPIIFCGLVVAPLEPLARFVADAAHPLLAALDKWDPLESTCRHASLSIL